METKICNGCNIEKNIASFGKHKYAKYGIRSICKDCERKKYKQYYELNKHDIIKRKIKSNNKRRKVRKQNDPKYKLSCNLRRRQLLAIKGKRKQGKTFDLIGCTPEFLKQYIENQFQDGMSWNNYGIHGWHIDHIRPCSSFDLSDSTQQKECFHYSNLQPLWAKDNLKKSDNWSYESF
jgi:hypothetical protein